MQNSTDTYDMQNSTELQKFQLFLQNMINVHIYDLMIDERVKNNICLYVCTEKYKNITESASKSITIFKFKNNLSDILKILSCKNFDHLYLSYKSAIDIQSYQQLMNLIEKDVILEKITLRDVNFTSENQMLEIITAISESKKITNFIYSACNKNYACEFMPILSKNKNLKKISLNITGYNIDVISDYLIDNLTLEKIKLKSYPDGYYRDFSGLINILSRNTTLKSIHLHGLDIGLDNASLISTMLNNNLSLSSLSLITFETENLDEVLEKIFFGLEKNTTLKKLEIYSECDEKIICQLLKSIENNNILEKVHITYNYNLNFTVICEIAELLENIFSVVHLESKCGYKHDNIIELITRNIEIKNKIRFKKIKSV